MALFGIFSLYFFVCLSGSVCLGFFVVGFCFVCACGFVHVYGGLLVKRTGRLSNCV